MKHSIHRLTLGLFVTMLSSGCNFESPVGPDEGTPSSDNAPPVARAGSDLSVTDVDRSGSELVTLDGSASVDPDGAIVTHVWSVDGRVLTNGASPVVSLPPGVHVVTLSVTDDRGAVATDVVLVTVQLSTDDANLPPRANAGADLIVIDNDATGSEMVTLDGTASTDPDGSIFRYAWTEGGVHLASGARAPVALGVGEHTITLMVVDSRGATGTDTVVITVMGTLLGEL